MSSSKEAARDVRYGRRGGRWAADGVSDRVQDLLDYKTALKRRGEWMTVVDRDCRVCPLVISAHEPACKVCGDSLSHHADGAVELCWEGRARMALARRGPGAPLNDVDLEAIDRYPNPASGLTRAA